LIATDGRLRVMTDPTASKFPWIPPTLIDILSAGPLVNKEGDEFEWDDLYDKEAVGVYFSAHWYVSLTFTLLQFCASTFLRLYDTNLHF